MERHACLGVAPQNNNQEDNVDRRRSDTLEEPTLPREDEHEIREPNEIDDSGLGDEPEPTEDDEEEDNAVFDDPDKAANR